MAAPTDGFRIRLVLPKFVTLSGSNIGSGCWFYVNSSTLKYVDDLKTEIVNRFDLEDKKIQLFLEDCLLPTWEKICVLRDNDLVTVRLEERNVFECTETEYQVKEKHKKNLQQSKKEPAVDVDIKHNKDIIDKQTDHKILAKRKSFSEEKFLCAETERELKDSLKKKKKKHKKKLEQKTDKHLVKMDSFEKSHDTGQDHKGKHMQSRSEVCALQNIPAENLDGRGEDTKRAFSDKILPLQGISTCASGVSKSKKRKKSISSSNNSSDSEVEESPKRDIMEAKEKLKEKSSQLTSDTNHANSLQKVAKEEFNETEKPRQKKRIRRKRKKKGQSKGPLNPAWGNPVITSSAGASGVASVRMRPALNKITGSNVGGKHRHFDSDSEPDDNGIDSAKKNGLCAPRAEDDPDVSVPSVRKDQLCVQQKLQSTGVYHNQPNNAELEQSGTNSDNETQSFMAKTMEGYIAYNYTNNAKFTSTSACGTTGQAGSSYHLGKAGDPLVHTRQGQKCRDRHISKEDQLNTVATNVSVIMQNKENPVEALSNNSEPGDAEECVSASVRDYSSCRELHSAPRQGDKIAYKVLEMLSDYTPGISEYKEAIVLGYDPETKMLELEVLCSKNGQKKPGRFDLTVEYEDEILTNITDSQAKVKIAWSSMLEPRLLEG